MRATGAAVIKVAVTAARLSDTLPLLEHRQRRRRGGDRHGRRRRAEPPAGDAVRIPMDLRRQRRRAWSDAAARMVDEFRFRAITEQTSVYGLAGEGALKSRDSAMRNAAFAAAGIDAVCVPLPAADAADIQTFADALGIIGWERCT